ncbi:MAG TPA: hypothetical protein DDY31_03185, partial [Lachnospiraceae bacterium]|nr:hypothetical protein [Lachnospiraceae bacterium]
MKKLKKIVGALLALSLVVTQFPVGGGKTAKADTETKTSITSSKLSFTYEKTGQDATTFTFCDTEVADFNGDGEYEIENAGSYTADGYEKLGDFASDTEYILKNVVLTINGTYEFVLKDTGYTWSDNGVYRLDLGNIYYQAESISYNSKDGKATLKYDGSRISLYLAEEANNPVPVETKTSITSSKLSFTYEKTGQDATTFTFCDTEVADFNGNGEYNIENAGSYTVDGYEKLGDFASDTEYILKNVVLTVNGKYEFVLKDTGYTWSDNGVYRLDLGNIYYQAESISYKSKDGKATLKYDGSRISLYVAEEANNPVPAETKTSITSSKLS